MPYVENVLDLIGISGISLNVVVVSAAVGRLVVPVVVLILPIKYIEPKFYLDKKGVIYHHIFFIFAGKGYFAYLLQYMRVDYNVSLPNSFHCSFVQDV